jgi:protein-disulfide isomerase
MRLTNMNLRRRLPAALAVMLGLSIAVMPACAQRTVGDPPPKPIKDASMIKPPAGAKVALWEFEDLECPSCGHAHPTVMAAVAHYKIPFVRKDFPLPMHIWSTDAAIWARYLQDKVSASVAADYRTAVFASQASIESKDEMLMFTRKFFQQHGLEMPFVVDPAGTLRKEVFDDKAVGDRLNVSQTPTILVCTQHEWVLVTDITKLYQTIGEVETDAAAGR